MPHAGKAENQVGRNLAYRIGGLEAFWRAADLNDKKNYLKPLKAEGMFPSIMLTGQQFTEIVTRFGVDLCPLNDLIKQIPQGRASSLGFSWFQV